MSALTSPASCLHESNLLTYLSLLAGVTAVAAALHGSGGPAGALLAVAVLADTFDGRFARLFPRTDAQRRFGAELDSLSDVAAFGLAPPICLFALSATTQGGVTEWMWWGAAFIYAAGAITRLGFYNLGHHEQNRSGTSDGFVGLPVPVAALMLSSALLAGPSPAASMVLLIATSLAMIAPWRVPRPSGAGLALF